MSEWSNPVPDIVAYRRASGRRHYNAVRQFRAQLRRLLVAQMLLDLLPQAEIARRLNVHRSTITRDVDALRTATVERGQCPCCGHRLNTAEVLLMKLAHHENNKRLGIGLGGAVSHDGDGDLQ